MVVTKWGIASAGLISSDFVNAVSTLPENEHKVMAVAARSLQAAEEFKQKFGIVRAYQGYQALAQDPDVDVVYIGVVNNVHLEVALMMLDGGKHVLCEKPLCINLKETKQLVDYARSKNLFLMEAIWSRCLPSYQAIQNSIDSGAIGDVKNVIVTFGKVIDEPRLHLKQLGGGSVLDLGVYCVQLAQLAMGKDIPEQILAGGHLGPEGVDESTSATLIYSGGRTATLVTSSRVDLSCEAVIVGNQGSIKVCYPFWTATEVQTPAGTLEWEVPAGAKLPFNFLNSANMVYEAQHVRQCLLAGLKESPLVPLEETITIAEIMQSIRTQVGVVYPQDEN